MPDAADRDQLPITAPVVMPTSPPYATEPQPPPTWAAPATPAPPAPPIPPLHPGSGAPTPPAPSRRSTKATAVALVLLLLLFGGIGVVVGATIAGGGTKQGAASVGNPFRPHPSSPPSSSSSSASDDSQSDPARSIPSPKPDATTPGDLSTAAIEKLVDPAIVDITVTTGNGEGAGTGMVLTADGVVLTNNHVIANATDIQVQSVTTDQTWSAKVLGYDSTDDVALIKLDGASGLTTITPGDSDNVTPGDKVVGLGNALGQGGTPAVSEGTVTQLGQSIDVTNEDGSSSTLADLIETSVRLQPGDSGGPLVDSSGAVIGMDAAASTGRRGRTTNDSYAIPINKALEIARNIEAGKATAHIHVGERALLGVRSEDGQSTVIAGVESGSPADAAGLTAGDTVTSVDGHTVRTVDDIVAALDTHKPGDEVHVTWDDANGQSHEASIELIAGPPA